MRILALDWGTVRIGAAISDEEGKIAFPLRQPIDAKHAVDEIKKIVSEKPVEKIIVGNPQTLDGTAGGSQEKTLNFIDQLKAELGLPVELIDERFSTVQAGKLLSEQGVSEQKQRSLKDNLAAQLILQQYLDTKI
jgi:putative Holliday junction resolvase